MKLLVKKLHPDAIIPKYQTKGAAGFDVHALVTKDIEESYSSDQMIHTDYSHTESTFEVTPVILLKPNSQFIVYTGLAFALPKNHEMQIRPRSGLAAKHGITIINSPGTLDEDFRGMLKIIIFNLSDESFMIKNGDRIAQCIIAPVTRPEILEVEELDETERGSGGLGSTGIK